MRFAEIDATVPVLEELKDIFAKTKRLEEELASDGAIDDVDGEFRGSIIYPGLKAHELPLSIGPRLESRVEALAVRRQEKVKEEWNKSVSIEKSEVGARILISNDIGGASKSLLF